MSSDSLAAKSAPKRSLTSCMTLWLPDPRIALTSLVKYRGQGVVVRITPGEKFARDRKSTNPPVPKFYDELRIMQEAKARRNQGPPYLRKIVTLLMVG